MKSSTSPLLQHLRHLAKCRQRDPKLPETPEALGYWLTLGRGL